MKVVRTMIIMTMMTTMFMAVMMKTTLLEVPEPPSLHYAGDFVLPDKIGIALYKIDPLVLIDTKRPYKFKTLNYIDLNPSNAPLNTHRSFSSSSPDA